MVCNCSSILLPLVYHINWETDRSKGEQEGKHYFYGNRGFISPQSNYVYSEYLGGSVILYSSHYNHLLRPCLTPGLIRLLRSHRSSTAQLRLHITYSGHGRADIPPLSMTLGLVPTQSLLHLTVYPALTWVLRVPVISTTLYHFHQTWFILLGPDFILPRPDLVLSPVIPCPLFRLFTCHRKYSSLALT